MKYRYFVSFSFTLKDGSIGFANSTVEVSDKPINMNDLDVIASNIRKHRKETYGMDISNLVILNFILLEAI